ncbi:MAG: glycosyltransferase family 2 protein, partial [Deltaproteobacteria bacterium]|nr:glycosyltransferase family 2 protein [Deltaproteobacteria bacterium]
MVLKINGCGGNPPEMLSHQQPRVHVFIYTFNKAAQLAETLKSLAATNYLNYKLIVLDNGSTDETQDILLSFDNGMFNGLKVISLPINIGAPAARNWLVHDEETRQAEYVVFFDDDIIVQPDWLIRMLDTFKNCPDAGVVGAKIINSEGKKVIQHSGGLLTQAEDWINRVVLFSNVPDDGRFDTIGQRDYLMGCANMYRRDVFDRVGDFDLQFSPTQFDDVDHHLRMRLHGLQ